MITITGDCLKPGPRGTSKIHAQDVVLMNCHISQGWSHPLHKSLGTKLVLDW